MPPRKLKIAKQSAKGKSKRSPYVSPNVLPTLNIECLLMIFSYLNISERIKVERVCKLWKEASLSGWIGFQHLRFEKSLWGFSIRTKLTVTDKILRTVLLRCGSNLRIIQFPSCERNSKFLRLSLSQRCLGNMLEMCPNLKILVFGFLYIRSSIMSILANSFFNLRALRLDVNGNMTDDDFSAIFASNKQLKIVHLVYQDSANICTCLKDLPKKSIEEVVICNCDVFYGVGKIQELFSSFINVSPKLQKLHKLSIHNVHHEMSAWSLNSCAESFTSLDLYSCRISHDGTRINLLALANLQDLDFAENFGETEEFLIAVSRTCTKLVKLVLRGCYSVTDRGLSAVTLRLNLKHLELIDLHNVRGMDLPKMHSLQYFKSMNCTNIKEDYCAQMLLTAAADSRTFELMNGYNEYSFYKKFPIFNGKILQAVAQIHQNHQNACSTITELNFQNDAESGFEERRISILVDFQKNNVSEKSTKKFQ